MGLREGTLERLSPEVRQYITTLEHESHSWRERVQELETTNTILNERLTLLLYRRFGRSSETAPSGQRELFAEAEAESGKPETELHAVEVAAHRRTGRGRKPIDERLPRVETVHDIDEQQKQCACGSELKRIGEEVSERVQVIPEQIWVQRHIRPKYACRVCEGSGDEPRPAVRIAAAAPSMIPGSITTAGLLAFILVNKFVDHLPFYRQEKRFERVGFAISRQDMSNWTIAVAKRIAPLIELFRTRIPEGPVVNMDETPVQVMGEAGRADTQKSYMWLARGGPRPAARLPREEPLVTAKHFRHAATEILSHHSPNAVVTPAALSLCLR